MSHKLFIQRLRLLRRRGGNKTGAVALLRVSQQSELTHHNKRPARNRRNRQIHFSLGILKHPQLGHLVGQLAGHGLRIRPGNAQQNHRARVNLPRHSPLTAHLGARHALKNRLHRRRVAYSRPATSTLNDPAFT